MLGLLGQKTSFLELISKVTPIPEYILSGLWPIESCSIAARMSWASRRRTSRIEDRAYSLLGIFGVHMPMLYGERHKAFLRLQEEIMKRSDDQSIFAWSSSQHSRKVKRFGLLAMSPDDFRHSSDIYNIPGFRNSYEVTNRGLSIHLPMFPYWTDTYVVFLDCRTDFDNRIGIFLRSLHYESHHPDNDQFQRVAVDGRDLIVEKGVSQEHRQVYERVRRRLIVPQIEYSTPYAVDSIYGFKLDPLMLPLSSEGKPQFSVEGGHWDANQRTITIPAGTSTIATNIIPVGFLIVKEGFNKLYAFAFHSKLFVPLIFISRELDLTRCNPRRNQQLSKVAQKEWAGVDWDAFAVELWTGLQVEECDGEIEFAAPKCSAMWIKLADFLDGHHNRNRVPRICLNRDFIGSEGDGPSCWSVELKK